MIENNPSQRHDPIECLARGNPPVGCSAPAGAALAEVAESGISMLRALSPAGDVAVYETSGPICDDACYFPERDNRVVYSDKDHLAVDFVLAQTDDLESFVRWILHLKGTK